MKVLMKPLRKKKWDSTNASFEIVILGFGGISRMYTYFSDHACSLLCCQALKNFNAHWGVRFDSERRIEI
jgi:hypothetical protein